MASRLLHVGTRKGLFLMEQTAQGWRIARTSFLGVEVPMLLDDPRDGTLYAAVEHGHFGIKFHASRDLGQTWEEKASPTYPSKPEDAPEIICPIRQKPVPWSLEKIWALEAGGADQPGLLWCGTIPGGLFKSADGGATWELVRGLWDRPERAKWFGGGYDWPGIHSIFVDPRDSRHVVVGVSCGGVWITRDGGDTWHVGQGLVASFMPPEQASDPHIQDPHRMTACPGAPDSFWIQHHSGIFRSQDGGENWSQITTAPVDFGFAVAVHPHEPKTAWFVPGARDDQRIAPDAAVCVTRTHDGGQTFEVLRAGLPQEHAYHLVFRHGLDVANDGQTLAFGSTTGSLWTSENGGDAWARYSADLPPIYCVRFRPGD